MICSLYDISTERYQEAKNYVIHQQTFYFYRSRCVMTS